MTDLLDLSALAQAASIARGEVSAVELTRVYLERIDALNPSFQAFVQVFAEVAPREAARRDRQRRARGFVAPSPLFGVPTAIKDLEFVARSFTRFGSRAFRWLWSPWDGPTARAMRRAGMVILGKTATSELGAMPVVEPDIHPPTRNPWNLGHSSGGSSGGAGSAVAGRLVPIAHGSDGAGSVRIPASFCGLFGYKPSPAALLNPYRSQDRHGLATVGPLARGMADLAALADVLRADPRGPSFAAAPQAPRPGLRVRLLTETSLGPVDPAALVAVRRVAETLAAMGHHIEPVGPLAGSIDEYLPIYQHQLAGAPVIDERLLQPVTRWLRAEGRRRRGFEVEQVAAEFRRRADAHWGDADVLLSPTVPGDAPEIGAFHQLPPEQAFHAAAVLGGFTAIYNLTGQPAFSLPAAMSARGLPLGVQLVGRRDADRPLFGLACALTEAMGLRALIPS